LEVREQANCRIYVVLTMRSDFLGECAQFFGLPEAINKGRLVPRLTREERRAAIVGPASAGGASIDAVLLTRLVNDVGDNPDQLSILQHALNRTWARMVQDGDAEGPMELRHYEAIGTMAQALNQHAEEAFAELCSERKKKICERIFKALTDTGTDARGIRRPTRVGTLCAIGEATEPEVTEVIEVFREPSRSFLMPPAGKSLKGGTVVDISHESLMRVWERLKRWGDEEARSARIYRRLAETAEMHSAGNASLLRDAELVGALDWRDRNQPNETWAMQYRPAFEAVMNFLEKSKIARDQQIAAERQRAKLWRWSAAGVMASLTAFFITIFALWYRAENQKELAATARSQRLASQALATEKWDLALLLSIAASEVKPTFDARDTLLKKVQNAPQGFLWVGPHQSSRGDLVIMSSQDGMWLVSGGADGSVMLWDVATRKPLRGPLLAHGGKITGLALSRNKRWLAAGISDGSVTLWDMNASEPMGETLLGTGIAGNVVVAFSSDDQHLISGSSDAGVILWDVTSRKPLEERLRVPDATDTTAVAISPDGRQLAFGGRDGGFIIYDVDERKIKSTTPTRVGNALITILAFHPNGKLLVLGNREGSVIWWDLDKQQEIPAGKTSSEYHTDEVLSLAFSPNGELLASSGKDGSVFVWDVDNHKTRTKPLRTGSGVRNVAFGKDELVAAVTGDNSGVVLWDVSGRNPLASLSEPVTSVGLSPDGKVLASGRNDKAVILWDVARHKHLGELIGHQDKVISLAFSPDGKMLASGSRDGAVIIWEVATHVSLGEPLIRQVGAVNGVAFSPDGKVLASVSDKTIVLWDVTGRKPLGDPVTVAQDEVTRIAFSPDGRLLAVVTSASLFLWDVAARKSSGEPLKGYQEAVSSVAFDPDGKVLASGGRIASSVIKARNRSTKLSQDDEVGMK
jgi:WD40 repeat protein